MLEFLKMFGMGILYAILSPLIFAFFLLFVVYSFINYLVCEVVNLGGFFLGKRFEARTQLEKDLAKAKEETVQETVEENVNQDRGDLNV